MGAAAAAGWAREFLLTHCVELRGVEVERGCSDIAGSWGA